MTTVIAKAPMPEGLSSVGATALREHRRLRGAELTRPLPKTWFLPVLILVSTQSIAILLVLSAVFGGGDTSIIGLGFAALLAIVGLAIAAVAMWLNRPFPEGAHGYAVVLPQVPRFMTALSSELGGTYQVTFDLAATLSFLDAHGIASVPRVALERLNLIRPERHRIEGARRGRPVAVEVVIGRPYSVPRGLRAKRDQQGCHLFVLAAGASGAEHFQSLGEHDGFEAFAVLGGIVLVRSLRSGLPLPEAVLGALDRLGAWQPPKPFPNPLSDASLPACTTAHHAVEAFLSALRDAAYDRALLFAAPSLGHGQWMEISAPVLEHIVTAGGVRPVAWTWSDIAEGALAAELDGAKLRFADGRELPVEIQLEKIDGTYRVSYYAGLGHRRVDPALRSAA